MHEASPPPGSASDPALAGRRTRMLIAGHSALAVLVVIGAVFLGMLRQQRTSFRDARSTQVCPGLAGAGLPYGRIDSCRTAGSEIHYLGTVDVSLYVLLETATGLVCLRVDYRNIGDGRRFSSVAAEVGAARVPALTRADRTQLAKDIRQRDGLRPTRWTIDHGDG